MQLAAFRDSLQYPLLYFHQEALLPVGEAWTLTQSIAERYAFTIFRTHCSGNQWQKIGFGFSVFMRQDLTGKLAKGVAI